MLNDLYVAWLINTRRPVPDYLGRGVDAATARESLREALVFVEGGIGPDGFPAENPRHAFVEFIFNSPNPAALAIGMTAEDAPTVFDMLVANADAVTNEGIVPDALATGYMKRARRIAMDPHG